MSSVSPDKPQAAACTVGSRKDEAPGLDALFRSEAPRLLRYFRRNTGSGDAASDMVQDAFVRLAGAAKRAELANPAAYLQRIARNLLFDRARGREKAEFCRHVSLDDGWDLAVPPDQEMALEARDLLARYEAAVSGLTEKTRRVFLLHRAQGLTYKDIQLRLGISMGTVEYHMMRAIAHIDRVMGAE